MNSKYLGLPLHIQREKVATFQPLMEKISRKLASWKSLMISQLGNGALIYSIASSIPTYTMSTFLLP